MHIKFYAHASFRLEGNGLSVVTDPYTPGPECSGYEPINEAADIVLMSSDNDRYHSDPSHVTGSPTVVNTLELDPAGEAISGLYVQAYPVTESLTFDYGERGPDDNAMYHFTLDGIRVLHIGDVGNAIPDEHLMALAGQVDLMLSLTGDNSTIALQDLDDAIRTIQPRVVIPMHYQNVRCPLKILPVNDFTNRYPADRVTWIKSSTLELTKPDLPAEMQIMVLEESR